MKRAFDFLGIASRLTARKESEPAEDQTLYKIKTNEHYYEGQILSQDNNLIVLKTEGFKVVRILKQNIQSIK